MAKTKATPVPVYCLLTQSRKDGEHYLQARFVYLDPEKHTPRNFLDDSYRDLPKTTPYLAGLGLNAHWYQGSIDPGEWLCHEIGYYDVYRVTADMADAMARTLRLIDKRCRAHTETFGYPRDFAEVLVRLGAAVGVAGYLIYREDTRRSWSYDDSEYQTLSAAGILSHIRALAAEQQAVAA